MRRKHNGLRPLKTVLHIRSRPSDGIYRPRIYRLCFASAVIVAGDFAAIRTSVDDFRIGRIGRDVTALAAANIVPIGTIDGAVRAGTGNANCRVVLLRTVDVIGESIVRSHVVKLRGRLIVNAGPALRAIGRDSGAAVVPVDQALRIGWIDPKPVIVAVRNAQRVKGFPAIVGTIDAGIQDVDGVRGFWIGKNVRVIPGTLAEAVILGQELPVLSAIIGAVNATLFRFHDGPHAVRVCSGNGYADTPENGFRQPM